LSRWTIALSFVLGCGAAAPHYPGEPTPPGELGPDVTYRQRLSAETRGGPMDFEVVVQKAGDTLVVLGLTPMGTRAFAITLEGDELDFETFVDQPMPFDPRWVMLDVQRSLFVGIDGAPLHDGTHEVVRGEERLTERWWNGALRWRSFRRGDHHVTAHYEGGWVPGRPPPPIRYENEWLGYELSIRTL